MPDRSDLLEVSLPEVLRLSLFGAVGHPEGRSAVALLFGFVPAFVAEQSPIRGAVELCAVANGSVLAGGNIRLNAW